MSISHSTGAAMLMNYNLSLLICMKPEYMILSTIILCPSSPGNDIDVHLQRLIEKLKELCETGIKTYYDDSYQTFQLCTALLWTITDFPAYAMLSGWIIKGRKAYQLVIMGHALNISSIVTKCVTWVIVHYYLLIIHFDEIRNHLTV